MPRVKNVFLALVLAAAATSGGLTTVTPAPVSAAGTPWTLPTVPPKCTNTQKNSGDVAGCVIPVGQGLPEDNGWPAPPFPEPVQGAVIPWVDLARGAASPIVEDVQIALNANGATLVTDGQFGSLTEAAVKTYQTSKSLPSTGVVNAATATALGVQNRAQGAFPGPGWTWLGWGYNGSAALYNWERTLITNTKKIGTVPIGSMRSFPESLKLFEGFIAEIQAGGYVVTGGAGGYVFRCTASTRKDCAGLTRGSLSNHSYGLAIDFNTTKNPMRTYYGVNGASACQTPMQTDMPQWVIQTAEKWGLYWGGYGWSSGCTSPSQVKSSASRDPMHFEFNGTVEQAMAIYDFNMFGGFGACVDVADAGGNISEKCFRRNEIPAANTRIVVETNAPAGATAALVNITTTKAASGGWIVGEGCGAVAVRPPGSNGNTRTGRAVASAAIVSLDGQGRFCLYQSTPMHTIVDVQGFFAPSSAAPNGTLYTPVTPQRVNDTRTKPYCLASSECFESGALAPGAELVSTSEAPVDAVATLANLTVTSPAGVGFVTADSCASLTPGSTTSNLNFATRDIVANLAVVPSATTEQGAQFCTRSATALHQIVDVQGFFAPASQGGLGYTALTPSRLDTRECWTDPVTSVERCDLPNEPGSVLRLQAPAGASAVAVNLTTTKSEGIGYLSAGACADLMAAPPTTSNVNAVPGASVANMAVVPVASDGTYCVYVSAARMHVIVDLMGTFSSGGALRYTPITPTRVHDSRPPV